jgi:hypothetical protein
MVICNEERDFKKFFWKKIIKRTKKDQEKNKDKVKIINPSPNNADT